MKFIKYFENLIEVENNRGINLRKEDIPQYAFSLEDNTIVKMDIVKSNLFIQWFFDSIKLVNIYVSTLINCYCLEALAISSKFSISVLLDMVK